MLESFVSGLGEAPASEKSVLGFEESAVVKKQGNSGSRGRAEAKKKESGSESQKKLTANVWLCEDYPISMKELQPILHVLGFASKHMQKLKDFLV